MGTNALLSHIEYCLKIPMKQNSHLFYFLTNCMRVLHNSVKINFCRLFLLKGPEIKAAILAFSLNVLLGICFYHLGIGAVLV